MGFKFRGYGCRSNTREPSIKRLAVCFLVRHFKRALHVVGSWGEHVIFAVVKEIAERNVVKEPITRLVASPVTRETMCFVSLENLTYTCDMIALPYVKPSNINLQPEGEDDAVKRLSSLLRWVPG